MSKAAVLWGITIIAAVYLVKHLHGSGQLRLGFPLTQGAPASGYQAASAVNAAVRAPINVSSSMVPAAAGFTSADGVIKLGSTVLNTPSGDPVYDFVTPTGQPNTSQYALSLPGGGYILRLPGEPDQLIDSPPPTILRSNLALVGNGIYAITSLTQ